MNLFSSFSTRNTCSGFFVAAAVPTWVIRSNVKREEKITLCQSFCSVRKKLTWTWPRWSRTRPPTRWTCCRNIWRTRPSRSSSSWRVSPNLRPKRSKRWPRKRPIRWELCKNMFLGLFFAQLDFLIIFASKGSGCSTAVECTPHIREVMGSNPAGFRAFSLLYPLSNSSLIQVPQGSATLLIFL